MSLPAHCWAIKQQVGNASERAVLSVLADFADKQGVCFPSVGTIAELCGMSRRGAGCALQRLAERKLLRIGAGTTARRYYLAMDQAEATKPNVPRETRADNAQGDDEACAENAGACAEAARHLRDGCAESSQDPVINQSGDADASSTHGNKPKAKTTRSRGTRLAEDWQPSVADIAFAEKHPTVDWRIEAQRFANYWLAKSGKDAAKQDWPRTWQNWIINEARYASERAQRAPGRGFNAAPPVLSPDQLWALRVSDYRKNQFWLRVWGPKPGEAGCRAPEG